MLDTIKFIVKGFAEFFEQNKGEISAQYILAPDEVKEEFPTLEDFALEVFFEMEKLTV